MFWPYTAQQNGIIECKHPHILELMLRFQPSIGILHFKRLSISSTYFRIQHVHVNPHNMYSFIKFGIIHPFGFLVVCFLYVRSYSKNKLDFYSLTCIFLGYHHNYKGYKYLFIPSGCVVLSRRVVLQRQTH